MKTEIGMGLAIGIALTLVIVSAVAATSRRATPTPSRVDMTQSAQAMLHDPSRANAIDHVQLMTEDGTGPAESN